MNWKLADCWNLNFVLSLLLFCFYWRKWSWWKLKWNFQIKKWMGYTWGLEVKHFENHCTNSMTIWTTTTAYTAHHVFPRFSCLAFPYPKSSCSAQCKCRCHDVLSSAWVWPERKSVAGTAPPAKWRSVEDGIHYGSIQFKCHLAGMLFLFPNVCVPEWGEKKMAGAYWDIVCFVSKYAVSFKCLISKRIV